MNVLITSAGRRNYLVRYFREALGNHGEVFVSDLDSTAPALYEHGRRVWLPAAKEPEFVPRLLAECRRLSIGLVVPLNDLELQVMARCRKDLEAVGTKIVVADPEAIELCLDKLETARFLTSHQILVPRTFGSLEEFERQLECRELEFPVVVKPRWGSGSIGVEVVHDLGELQAAYVFIKKKVARTSIKDLGSGLGASDVLLQEYIGGDEYGLDVINDLEGRYAGTIVRRKIGMRAGETDRAEIVSFPLLQELGEKLGKLLRHRGNLDVDVKLGAAGPVVIEMNPRFGGGYPFSHEAGADVPKALILWASGQTPSEKLLEATVGWRGAKYDLIKSLGQV